MQAVERRTWCSYAAQAQNHRDRAARFRRYADEASNPSNRELYLRVVAAEEALAVKTERLSKRFQIGADGLDTICSEAEGYPV
jgi:hypothetical protein